MLSKMLLASALILALGQLAMAQDSQTTAATTTAESVDMAAMEYDVRASDLLGAEIENSQDEEIGEIDDLTITGKDKVLHAVISVGGFLGIGDKRVAVPYDKLQIQHDDNEIDVVYNATKAELENMPAFSYRDGDLSWRERVQERMDEWTDRARDAVQGVTQDDVPSADSQNN